MKVKQIKSDYIFDIVNTFILCIVFFVVVYPLIYVISASFSDPMTVVDGQMWLFPMGFNLNSYKKIFENRQILTGYKNSIVLTLTGTAVNVIMTTLGAYPLSRKDLIGRNALMLIITFTMMFSGGMIPLYLIVRKLGIMDSMWALIFPGCVSAWNMVIMRTFFQNTIPLELQEAAFIDGCSNIRLLLLVVLPLSSAIIAIMVLFYGVGHWNAYFNAVIYLRTQEKFPLQVILREILFISTGTETSDGNSAQQLLIGEGLKYALIIVASVPVMILYPFLQKYFVKGMMVGAIKG